MQESLQALHLPLIHCIISGNIGIFQFSDIDPKDPATQIPHGSISTESALYVTGAFGKHFDSFRIDAEFGYQRNDADKISMHGMDFDLTGHFSTTSYLVNGYYDFHIGSINTCLPAEIGVIKVIDPPDIIHETNSTLGYQFGIGIAISLTECLCLNMRHRYYCSAEISFNNNHGDFDVSSNSILFGLRYEIQ